ADGRDDPDPIAFIKRVPPAVYEISGTAIPGGDGRIRLLNERQSPPMAEWNVRFFGQTWRRTLSLPVDLESLRIDGDLSARAAIRSLSVRAISVPPRERLVPERGHAIRAARYGSAVLYFMAGRAFVESGGTWIAGGDKAHFVVLPDRGTPLRLFVRNA